MIYLVRHGEAESGGSDAERALTVRGAADVERIANWAARSGISVAEIRHSGKKRAEETAWILAESLRPDGGVRAVSGIAPNDDPSSIAAELAAETRNVMLVSHLPFLARLASLLVTGDERPIVDFHPATLVAVERDDEGFTIALVIHPDRIG